MEYFVIAVVAMSASLLTFFSGFGLGTLLMPAFALFFPIEVAIALTGVVHLLNNLFKMTLVGRKANWRVVFKFGSLAILGAVLGAWLLMHFSTNEAWFAYKIGSKEFQIIPAKIIIAVLMFGFALMEFLPFYKNLKFNENKLFIGGAISGFFGGLSGHQGALRSAFLIKCGLSKESFVATGIIIASVIDVSRISVYFSRFSKVGIIENSGILLTAVLSAFIGAFIGRKLLKKITIGIVQVTVSVMIMTLAVLLGAGII